MNISQCWTRLLVQNTAYSHLSVKSKVSFFHVLLEYISPRVFSSLKSITLQVLPPVFLVLLNALHSQMAYYCYFFFYFLVSSGVFFCLFPALSSQLQVPTIASPFGYFLLPRCWWLSSRSAENVALSTVHRHGLSKNAFVWKHEFSNGHFSGSLCHCCHFCKQKPERSQPISAGMEDTNYLEIPGYHTWGDSLITRKTYFNFWKVFLHYWILSLMPLVRYLPCLEARNSRPGARGRFVPKPRAQHARTSIWKGRGSDQAPEAQPQARIHYLNRFFEKASFLVTMLPQRDTSPSPLSQQHVFANI